MLQVIKRKKSSQPVSASPEHPSFVQGLQKQIANAFNLYLNYKHYHWQASSAGFRDLNIIFDEFANEVHSTVEELAEDVRMMDQSRIRIKEFRSIATVKPAKRATNVRKMIEEANGNVLKVIGEIDSLISQTGNNSKLSSKLKKVFQLHEKHQWWLQYILKNHHSLSASAK